MRPSSKASADPPAATNADASTTHQRKTLSAAQYPHRVSRLGRIAVDPAVCHGQPVVRGLRYPVQSLLELLSSEMTIQEVLADYPDLERQDLLAALQYGAFAAGGHRVVPLGAA